MLIPSVGTAPNVVFSAATEKKPESTTSSNPEQTDTVDLSSGALKKLEENSSEADKTADAVSFAANALSASVDMANLLRGEFKKENAESIVEMLGAEGAKRYFDDLKSKIEQVDQSVVGWSNYVSERYSVSGALPTQENNGAWARGEYSLSSLGSGYEIRAAGDGAVTISRNGSAFTPWASQPNIHAAHGNSAANVALQTLKAITSINYFA